MSEDIPPIERLDLRFKAAPVRQSESWLPGSIWLWFALGIIAGVLGWQFGQKQLSQQLGQRVQPDSNPADALLALQALDLLDTKDQSYFVKGLSHPDIRVARSALQMLAQRIEQWPKLETTLHYAELRTLANLLDTLPRDLPDENRTLVRGLAARLYSTCVAIDDPQLHSVSRVCQQLMTLQLPSESMRSSPTELPIARLVPPEPLPKFTDTASFQLSDEAPASTSNSNQNPSQNPLNMQPPLPSSSGHSQDSPITSFNPAPPPNPNCQNVLKLSDSDQTAMPPELPVLVSAPASIASQPIVRMRVVSNKPNLEGIENAEPAELVRLLSSQNSNVAKGAALSLRHQGFSDAEIALASELATASAQRRIELIQQIAASGDMAPQPWLIWMAEDGQPEVRRMAISLLSSMQTEQVQRSLRMLLFRETDQDIKDLIRKVLLSASNR